MHAIVIDGPTLAWRPVPDLPAPGPGQVRLRVRATAVNRADLAQRAGLYPPPPGASEILGLECSGHVEALGAGVQGWAVGDAACALLSGGGYAEQVLCPADQLLPVPAGMSVEEAAGLPEVWATAWLNLVDEGGLAAGQRVLLHAGASGVGTAAVQICRAWGARSWVIVGSADKIAAAVALGADGGSDRHAGPWQEAVRAWAPQGVDLVLDPVGGATLAADLEVLATGGRAVIIGLMGGRSAQVDLGRLLVRRLRIQGSVLRSRPPAEKARIVAGLRRDLWPRLAAGELHSVVAARFPLDRAAQAHERIASDQTIGKVLLIVP